MLVIRNEQIKAFEPVLLDSYIERETEYTASAWPDIASLYPGREGLREFVSTCIRKAVALGFRDRGQLRKLLDWECGFGEGFSEKPEWAWLRLILEKDIDPASRIFRIENRLEKLRESGGLPT